MRGVKFTRLFGALEHADGGVDEREDARKEDEGPGPRGLERVAGELDVGETGAVLAEPHRPGDETPQEAKERKHRRHHAEEAALVGGNAKTHAEGGDEHDQREDETKNREREGSLTGAAYNVKQNNNTRRISGTGVKIRIFLGPTSPPGSVYSWQTSPPSRENEARQKPRVP